jgi:BspA type Leucine rich repeat region (6 copies)
MKTSIQKLFIALVWLALPALVQAQFTFTTNNGAITITGYNTAAGLNVVIPAATNGYPVTSIGVNAFTSSGITNVTIPNSVTSIGTYAFYQCTSLTSVTIPNSVTSIGDGVFNYCTSLTSVTIPNSVTSIGTYAFALCFSLTSVTIPNSVTSIGEFAFDYCTSLTSITVDASNPAYSSMNGVLFDKAQATLLQFPGGLGGSYTIPNSVTSIGFGAFHFCTSLTSVTIPNSVTSIGDEAFYHCPSLTSVTIPNSVTSIGGYAFYTCTSLTSAYFLGNEPPDNGNAFDSSPATVYYLAGTTGWGSTFGSVPAVLWNPQANTFSFTGGHFGFNLTGPRNAVIVVEACTNLSHPVWLPVSTNTLSGLGTSAFSDPTGYPMRYYRFRSP